MSNADSMFDWRKAILKSDLPPTTRHVLLTLACHMNVVGESCYPSIELLCKETGLSNRAVITHLQNAKELGWITVGKHGFAGQRWAAHEYFPAWPHHLREAAESFAKAVNVVHNVSKKAVNVVPKGSEPNDKKAVKEVHSSNPSSNPESKSIPPPDKSGSPNSDIPDWISSEAWEGFVSMRARIRRPLTPYAMKLAVKSLEKLRDEGQDPNACLDQSTLNSWQSIHPVKSHEPANKKEKFDPVAYVNRNRPNGGSGHEIVIEPEKRN